MINDAQCEPFVTPWREAKVVRIVDGDTFDLSVDLGFDVHTVTRFRLVGADAWEHRGEEREDGLLATARAKELMPEGTTVRIVSHKGGSRGKYGRWLAEVVYRTAEGWQSLAEQLIKEGHAEIYE